MSLVSDQFSSLPTLLFRADESVERLHAALAGQNELHGLVGTEFATFQVESLLGRGGMGWVFLARHLKLGRPCALKILSP
ncbi:MAG: hypothetical protein KDA58_04465, partial [Planctomycetaceae bacterium]|nr:hypothetical protein [Planctomycetaceae bacterium]